ncbi:MAG TPA: iron chelate uptake ABC transporter family permease subunit [Paenirhodobacter sp.]
MFSKPAMRAKIGVLVGLVVVAAALWMFQGLGSGRRDFILGLRWEKLTALILIGTSVAVATVLFQTVSRNRILTPSIMGFDALYLLIQTLAVAALGVAGFAMLAVGPKFLIETALMAVLALGLFGALLGRGGGTADDIARTILTGVVLGILFRAGSSLIGRLLDPNAYATVQAISFANFGRPNAALIGWGAALSLPAIAIALWLGPRLDVLGLGRDRAVTLGLNYRAMVMGTLALTAVLVAVSTALVGPVAFLGLIVAGLTHGLFPAARHRLRLLAAALIACLLLVLGQWVFERILGQQAVLSVVIEFVGGVLFLVLLLRGRIR